MSKKRKKNPKGNMYQIYIAPFGEGYRKNEKLVWEGYGEDNPWEVFDEFIQTHRKDTVTLYVLGGNNLFHELAQYENGKIFYE
jgi:hypothetical protein